MQNLFLFKDVNRTAVVDQPSVWNFSLLLNLLAGILIFCACARGESPTISTPSTESDPVVRTVSGNEQSGIVATELAQPLAVKVSDTDGEPMSGARVTWTVTVGEGSLSSTSTTTNDQGQTHVNWTLGTIAGKQEATAAISEGSSSVTFTATAEPGEPVEFIITPESVTMQTWGDSLQLSASMADEYGNVIESGQVTWSSSNSDIVSVDENGWARSYWAARPGEAIITAGLEGMEATVEAEVIAQPNPQCQMLTTFPSQMAVAGIPSFVEEDRINAPAPPYYANDATVGDFDGDGDEDIVAYSYNAPWDNTGDQNGVVLFWKNDGTGYFTDATEEVLEPNFIKSDMTRDFEAADFNGDGILDIYAAQTGWDEPPYPGGPNLLLLSNGGGTMTNRASTNLSPYETTGFTHSSASADVDCDGDIDIYEGDLIDGGPHLQINNGAGSFMAEDERLPARIAEAAYDDGYATAEFSDVDRDGDPDLVLGEIGFSGDVLLINDGFGFFHQAPHEALPPPYFTTGDYLTAEIKTADVDLDGWPDLLVSATPGYNDGHLAYWKNNGDGTFTDATAGNIPQPWAGTGVEGWIFRLHIADFNGDGWPDMLADRHLLINQGGTFVDATGDVYGLHDDRVEMRDYSTFIAFPIDADKDGSNDILVMRGWYLFQKDKPASALILRNMN